MSRAYFDETGVFCFLVNLRCYLQCYHLDMSESTLAAMLGYWGFYYSAVAVPSKEVVHGRSGTHEDLFARFMHCLAQPLTHVQLATGKECLQSLRELLEQDHIPLVWINDFYLAHTEYAGIASYWSVVPILDVREDQVLFFDNGRYRLNPQVFCKAVDRNGQVDIHYTSLRTIWQSESAEKAIARGLMITVDRLGGASIDNEYQGVYGMVAFMRDVERSRDMPALYNYYRQLNRPGGLSITRGQMHDLCTALQHRWPALSTEHCAAIYNQLSNTWRVIANLLFKLSRTDDRQLQQRLAQRIRDIVDLEQEGFESVKAIAEQLQGMRS